MTSLNTPVWQMGKLDGTDPADEANARTRTRWAACQNPHPRPLSGTSEPTAVASLPHTDLRRLLHCARHHRQLGHFKLDTRRDPSDLWLCLFTPQCEPRAREPPSSPPCGPQVRRLPT